MRFQRAHVQRNAAGACASSAHTDLFASLACMHARAWRTRLAFAVNIHLMTTTTTTLSAVWRAFVRIPLTVADTINARVQRAHTHSRRENINILHTRHAVPVRANGAQTVRKCAPLCFTRTLRALAIDLRGGPPITTRCATVAHTINWLLQLISCARARARARLTRPGCSRRRVVCRGNICGLMYVSIVTIYIYASRSSVGPLYAVRTRKNRTPDTDVYSNTSRWFCCVVVVSSIVVQSIAQTHIFINANTIRNAMMHMLHSTHTHHTHSGSLCFCCWSGSVLCGSHCGAYGRRVENYIPFPNVPVPVVCCCRPSQRHTSPVCLSTFFTSTLHA